MISIATHISPYDEPAKYSDGILPEGILEFLGPLEVLGYVAVVVVAGIALRRRRSPGARRTLWALVIVFALTLAQPFGYESRETHRKDVPSHATQPALPGERLDTRSWHAFELREFELKPGVTSSSGFFAWLGLAFAFGLSRIAARRRPRAEDPPPPGGMPGAHAEGPLPAGRVPA